MRCPKCGYISFDHLAECLKCNKNITAISDNLYGSTYNIQAPAFLHLDKKLKEEPSERIDLSGESFFTGDDEYVDEELEILVDEVDSDIEGGIGFVEDEQVDLELSGDDGEEGDGEVEIDFSQFEDADELKADLFDADEVEEGEQQEQVAQPSLSIEVPDELSDISDLAPPEISIEEDEQPPGKHTDSDFADLDLDDLNFDLDLGVMAETPTSKPEVPEEAVLTLDEIDFTETLAESSSETSKKSETIDMDLDMDFDLDLGELSMQNEA
jgi:hypothetical protein